MTTNQTQKKLIYTLTTTHQTPALAYKKAIAEAQTQQERQQLKAIYKAIKGKELEQEAQK